MRIRDEKKEKLVIDKALGLLVSDGFEGFSMNKLSKACNISVATLYIYYKDKDDLIKKIGQQVATDFFDAVVKDFSADMSFPEGLRQQWYNRMNFALKHPTATDSLEILRHSPHWEHIIENTVSDFKKLMTSFYTNCITKKQLVPLNVEVYWSIAFGPLYSLLRFHAEGKSMGGKPFRLTEPILEESLAIAIKALTP